MRSSRIDAAINHGFAALFKLLTSFATLIVPIYVALYLARAILSGVSLWLQMLCLIVGGLLLVGAILIIALPNWRSSLLSHSGALTPIWYAINVLFIATIFFATISTLLSQAS